MIAYSRADSSTGRPSSVTVRAAVLTVIGPTWMRGFDVPPERRIATRARAVEHADAQGLLGVLGVAHVREQAQRRVGQRG